MENAKSMLTEVSPKDSRGLLTQNGRSLRSVSVFSGSKVRSSYEVLCR